MITSLSRSRLLASTLFASTALVAPAAGVALAGLLPTAALAQDYTQGSLVGQVSTVEGAPVANAQVEVTSNEQGFSRQFTTNENGQFRAPALPLGVYTVTVQAPQYQTLTDASVRVRAGGESSYSFELLGEGEVAAVTVTATTARPELDFAQTETGLTVDIEELSDRVPVARSITAVTLLAPQTVQGGSADNAAFAGLPSIGGSSVAENAFFVNGLNITNFDNYLGAGLVPFDFYRSVDVKTGGYSAEFGRSTGGIINSVTKSGTNDFRFAVRGFYEPGELAQQSPETVNNANNLDFDDQTSLTLEAGGPIIRDRLFFFALANFRDVESEFASIVGGSFNVDRSNDPFYGAKIDANITDRQRLEFTYFDTTRETERLTYSFDPATRAIGTTAATTTFLDGGENYVARYTGQFTDWFTLSAAYGKSQDRDATLPQNTRDPIVSDQRSGTSRRISTQNVGQIDQAFREREFYRADADLFFDFVGEHHIRMGFDQEDLLLDHTTSNISGQSYIYFRGSANDAQGVPAGQDYIRATTFRSGGQFTGQNRALYIQDAWDVNDRLNLQLGVRRDQFRIDNAAGQSFIEFDNEIGARLGFSYDVFGDNQTRVFGFYGRYYLPVAANTAYRQGASELFFREFFYPVGGAGAQFQIDPVTGLPVGGLGPQITSTTNPGFRNPSTCPAGGRGTAGARGCIVLDDGVAGTPDTTVARDLKSTYQDEFILGVERRFANRFTARAVLTYRDLGRTAEDAAIDRAVLNYCAKQNIAGCDDIWDGFHQYVNINPGSDHRITLSDPIAGETTLRTVNFTAAELGYPTAKREYLGLELSFERPFDGVWGLQGSYVASRSEGNSEGFVKSDVGQDDAGITQDFDQPGLTDNSYGLLPNHRAHVVKLFGTYAPPQVTGLTLGANFLYSSPKKYGCLGVHPTDDFAAGYGASSFFCQGRATPRGTQFESDHVYNVDLKIAYTVGEQFALPGDLILRADIFNIFGFDNATEFEEQGDRDSGAPNPDYKQPLGYQRPRYVRIGFDLEF